MLLEIYPSETVVVTAQNLRTWLGVEITSGATVTVTIFNLNGSTFIQDTADSSGNDWFSILGGPDTPGQYRVTVEASTTTPVAAERKKEGWLRVRPF